ncbi:MAG: transposase [Thermodesulfobacteriota bacterium]
MITRGNQRQQIFRATADNEQYLKILEDYKFRYDFLIFAYVLMENHVHLLMETKEVPLSKILQGINQRYTMYFNRKYTTLGHLFQGRYKAILCEKETYLLSLVKYIHMNPVRVGIAKNPGEYRWSSHLSYIGKVRSGGVVDSELVLKMFGDDRREATRAYREYMEGKEMLRREDVYATVDQRIVGNEKFVEEVKSRTGRLDFHGRRKYLYSLPEIGKAVEAISGVSLEELRGKGRGEKLGQARVLMSLVAKQYGYKGREVAEYLWRDPSVITRYLEVGDRLGIGVENIHTKLAEIQNKSKKQA